MKAAVFLERHIWISDSEVFAHYVIVNLKNLQ